MKSCRECVHGETAESNFVHCQLPIPPWVKNRWGVELQLIRLDHTNADICPTYQPREERR